MRTLAPMAGNGEGDSPELKRAVRRRRWPRVSFPVGVRRRRRQRRGRAVERKRPVRRSSCERREWEDAMQQEASTGRKPPIYSPQRRACGSAVRPFSAANLALKDDRAWQPCVRLPSPSAGAADQRAGCEALQRSCPRAIAASNWHSSASWYDSSHHQVGWSSGNSAEV